MSRDGYLPDDVSEARFNAAFPPDCPDSCRSMQVVYLECGGIGACKCFWRFCAGPCGIDPAPECDCLTPSEIRAERDERRAEMMEDW